jgi:hypothetical protein
MLGPYEAKHPAEHIVRELGASEMLPAARTLGEVVESIFKHLGHSKQRDRPGGVETHNTEWLDNFTTDTAADWQQWTSSSWTYDAVNGERAVAWGNSGGPKAFRFAAGNAGSIDHEAQVSGRLTAPFRARLGLPSVRQGAVGERTGYVLDVHTRFPSFDIYRVLVGVVVNLFNGFGEPAGYAIDSEEWVTMRLAASGAFGANVLLHAWAKVETSTTKPADPGWIGVDASPQWTVTDSAVDRLDDGSTNDCGIANTVDGSSSTADAKYDYFKLRAIADRGGVDTSLAGTAAGVGTLTGDIAPFDMSLGGTAAGVGTATADLTLPLDMSLGGQADGVGTLSGNLLAPGAPVVPGAGGGGLILTLDLEGFATGDATLRPSTILTLPESC